MRRVWLIGLVLTAVLGGGGLFLLRMLPSSGPSAGEPTAARTEAAADPEALARENHIVRVPILVYHAVRPIVQEDGPLSRQYTTTTAMFERHLAYLKSRGYVTIGFDDLYDAVLAGKRLPEHAVILTFDDGSWTHYENVFPLLKAYGFTGTFFVFSNAIDRPGYLTSAQMKEMRAAGMVFGNHTRLHQYLTRIPPDEAVAEIREGKRAIERVLGEEIDVIAYPFGLHDDDIVAAAALLGHRMGRTIEEGRDHGPDDLMTLGSYQMYTNFPRLLYALGG